MRTPIARPTKVATKSKQSIRAPRAFAAPEKSEIIESFSETQDEMDITPVTKRPHILRRILFASIGLLTSLALGLAAERLIRDLFARYDWLGWVGVATLGVLVLVMFILALREIAAVRRFKKLDALRARASEILASDNMNEGSRLIAELQILYSARADMARPRSELDKNSRDVLDGSALVETAERTLMAPLDARAKALTAAAARRVALVTAISPRALVDLAFVSYESFKLARAIASLYGARPGLLGSWRLAGAILSHLAVTGGVALGDSVVQQLLGHGLAAKLSARLGEGLVNGLMTVRVGISAMRVTRPLNFHTQKQPKVMDFMADLARLGVKSD